MKLAFTSVLVCALLTPNSQPSHGAPSHAASSGGVAREDKEFTVGQLIDQLASPRARVRERAEAALRTLGRAIWEPLHAATHQAPSKTKRQRALALLTELTDAATVELLPARKPGGKARRWEQIWRASALPYLRVFRDQSQVGMVRILDLWARKHFDKLTLAVFIRMLRAQKVKCEEVNVAREVVRDYLAASMDFRPISGLVAVAQREKDGVVVMAEFDDPASKGRKRVRLEVKVVVGKGCEVKERSRRLLR
ncbi:MAG: hypothetical protein JRH20_20545 [Deltaproteobacteria bacterium]|nr:hypothetical protein [Deltaproteobacteria bacterium]